MLAQNFYKHYVGLSQWIKELKYLNEQQKKSQVEIGKNLIF